MKALLVDDEPKSREVLRTLLGRYCPHVQVIGEAGGVKEAKLLALHLRPDVIFLDVEMPGGNGFRLLDELHDPSIGIIFVTSYGHYAIPALRYSAIDYLLKPVEIDELQKAVARLATWMRSPERLEARYEALKNNLTQPASQQRLAIHGVSEIRFAAFQDIVRMEGDNNYTYIYTTTGEKHLSSRTLKDYEELLSGMPNFVRVHKTHLVNTDHIHSFVRNDNAHLVMSDGSIVEVSRRKKQELIDRMGL